LRRCRRMVAIENQNGSERIDKHSGAPGRFLLRHRQRERSPFEGQAVTDDTGLRV
jgi:hypothetical protein